MNLFHIKKVIPIFSIKRLLSRLCIIIPHSINGMFLLFFALSFLFITSCIDEKILTDNKYDGLENNIEEIILPGFMGINIAQIDNTETRDDNATSDNRPFSDGLANEYAIAVPNITNGEYYHYLILFKSSDSNAAPWIFPINASSTSPNSNNNITLTINKVLSNKSDEAYNDNNPFLNVKNVQDLKDILKNLDIYMLLNFKHSDDYAPNYSLNNSNIKGANTVEKLFNLKRSQLESLKLTDYKTKIRSLEVKEGEDNDSKEDNFIDRNYFIMSNSVYSDGYKKIIDGSIISENVFIDEATAVKNPAVSVYVERIASKVTVNFDIAKMADVKYDPNTTQLDIKGVKLGSNGLPEISVEVQKVTMTNGSGIEFNDQDGYKILHDGVPATIRILGYGLNNVEYNSYLFKKLNGSYNTNGWSWNHENNHRSYWSEDSNYQLVSAGNSKSIFKKVIGYPHQFRQALDTDSVTSLHVGLNGGYAYTNLPEEDYIINGKNYTAYGNLGEINQSRTIDDVYLNYKSFENLINEFSHYWSSSNKDEQTSYTFYPLYTLENTYYDQGMNNGRLWSWPWQRAPYATATNLILMAEIVIQDNSDTESNGDPENKVNPELFTRNSEFSSDPRTVYLGQNNIFYLKKENLLKSKLAILNRVMLSGGNAGLQILHGLWDQHKRWEEGDENQGDDSHLDKVAWNENSKLWFAKVDWQDETQHIVKTENILDNEGKVTGQRVCLLETKLLEVSDDIINYLDLIPAEISGGDGQALIAPHEDYMGREWRYYLAPETVDSDDTTHKMETSKAVEISYNHLVALIHKIIGPVDVYTNGKMYYSVPVPHRYAVYNNRNNADVWKDFGAFSIVRNNWYDISVEQINYIGTPVHDLTQPIVPVMDVKRSYINLGVRLKEWHQIVQDNIPLM